MSQLGRLSFLGVAFPNVLAAPPSVLDAVSPWVPASLTQAQRAIYDFLNPLHAPSVTQAIISCTVLIIISAVTAGPTVIPYPRNSTRFQAFGLRIHYVLYGLVAPDFLAITSWFRRIAEATPVLLYNRLFNKDVPKKLKWTAIHGAFVINGGFVLWEDNKPAKVLSFNDIFRMVKSKEIELPPLSKQDILARSTRAPGYITVWFLVLPLYWFIWKFTRVLPAFTLLAITHGALGWYAYFWRSRTITAVVEPVVLFRKAREIKELISDVKVDDIEKGASQASDNSEKDLDTSVVDALNSADLSEKTVDCDDEIPVTTANKSEVSPLSLALTLVRFIFVQTVGRIFQLFLAITSPMRAQWLTISGLQHTAIKLHCYIAGTVVTLLGWTEFYPASHTLPFPSEVERYIWRVSSLFLILQPFILLLAPRWIRSKIRGSVKQLVWIIYNLAYIAARISIFVIVVHTVTLAT